MDEANVHQFWGISPPLDLCGALPLSRAGTGADTPAPAFLQVCPYDCRHTLATLCSWLQRQHGQADGCGAHPHAPATQNQKQQQQQQLQLYVYEPEPELLARHMLLLVLLLDASLTPRERAEAFLELHGNALLRQRTADWLHAASVWLERYASQGAVPQPQLDNTHVQDALAVFDLSRLRYKERDMLAEACQHYRSKACFDMAAAWEGRCRKWYGDRYDARHNLVDWDYHMRLAPRGTPALVDPAAGSIIHVHHFRHWRLTGVAHELRASIYSAPNTSLLATAYGRTREYKDRSLRDVGRSVSAFGYWGDALNSPYHAFGTTADDAPALFKRANQQFSHTAVDVAEHNVLGFIRALSGCGGGATSAAAAHGCAARRGAAAGTAAAEQGHRAHAAHGPTSIDRLAGAAGDQDEGGAGLQPAPQPSQPPCSSSSSGTSHDGMPAPPTQDAGGPGDQAQQASGGHAACPLTAADGTQQAALAAVLGRLAGCVRIHLLTGDLSSSRAVTSKAAYAGRFAAATLGHRHAHLLAPAHGLARVLQPGAPLFLETAHNMVQLSGEQVAAFEQGAVRMARESGFVRAASCWGPPAAGWRLPPGHCALVVTQPSGQQQQQAVDVRGVSTGVTPPGYAVIAHHMTNPQAQTCTHERVDTTSLVHCATPQHTRSHTHTRVLLHTSPKRVPTAQDTRPTGDQAAYSPTPKIECAQHKQQVERVCAHAAQHRIAQAHVSSGACRSAAAWRWGGAPAHRSNRRLAGPAAAPPRLPPLHTALHMHAHAGSTLYTAHTREESCQ